MFRNEDITDEALETEDSKSDDVVISPMTNTRRRKYDISPIHTQSQPRQPVEQDTRELIIEIDSSESFEESPFRIENVRDDVSESLVQTAVGHHPGTLNNAFDDESKMQTDEIPQDFEQNEQNIPENIPQDIPEDEIENEIPSSIPTDDAMEVSSEHDVEKSHENAEHSQENTEISEDLIEQLTESQEQSTESQEHSSHSIAQSYISPPRPIRQFSDTPDFDQISRRMTANKAKYLKKEEGDYLNVSYMIG